MNVLSRGFVAALFLPLVVTAQGTPAPAPATLSVEQAIDLALANNPQLRQSLNARRTAAAATRSAYGQLLPGLSSSAGMSWREGRQQVFNGVGFGANANTVGTNASVNASLLSPAALALWATLILVISMLGMATVMLGLVVAVPWLAHSSWHAYRDLIQPAEAAGDS